MCAGWRRQLLFCVARERGCVCGFFVDMRRVRAPPPLVCVSFLCRSLGAVQLQLPVCLRPAKTTTGGFLFRAGGGGGVVMAADDGNSSKQKHHHTSCTRRQQRQEFGSAQREVGGGACRLSVDAPKKNTTQAAPDPFSSNTARGKSCGGGAGGGAGGSAAACSYI